MIAIILWLNILCFCFVCVEGQAMSPPPVEPGFLKTFFEKTKDMTPEERASYLEEDKVDSIHWCWFTSV